jgi:hypothetical protein
MKKKIALMFLILLASSLFAQNLTETISGTSDTGLEILSNWQALAILAIIISVILVAIAYAIGIGFEMPGMQAWARGELTQVFANVIIIIALFATVAFIDIAVVTMVSASGVGAFTCDAGESCLNKTSNAYIDDYIDSAKIGAKNVLKNNMEASAWANRRVGIYCYTIYCAQLGLTTTLAANYILDSDRYGIIFEYYTGILSSLHAQKFFINEISFKVGPLLLALGIVARAFFFSRRTGGLLIAIAAGIMFFFPAMYIFDWMSLDMTMTGDNAVQDEDVVCPKECGFSQALAYYFNSTLGRDVGLQNTSAVYALFDAEDRDEARQIILGNKSSANGKNGLVVYTCEINSSKPGFSQYKVEGGQDICDRSCRELPYPSGSSNCANYSMQLACSKIPEACKVKRLVVDVDPSEQAKCLQECRLIPPLKSNCNVKNNTDTGVIEEEKGDCLKSRFDCRVTKYTDLTWRPSIDKSLKGAEKCNTYPKDCLASTNANESCVWVMPEFGACDDLCTGCPQECRFASESDLNINTEPQCFDNVTEQYLSECKSCAKTCKINITQIQAKAPTDSVNCNTCALNRRILPGIGNLPEDYTSGNCSLSSCPSDYRVQVPVSACESCIDVEEKYTYEPSINLNCGDICKPPDNVPSKTSGSYSKIGEDGLVGREEIQNVSKLFIPGYLLPLFNIAATIIVIRTLAGMLGGDIEIPGLSKIF